MSFRLRVATMTDLPRLRKLIDASVRALQASDYTAEAIDASLKTVFTIDTQLIKDGTYFVALSDDDEFAGCGGWSMRKTLYGGDHQVQTIEPELLIPSRDAAKVRRLRRRFGVIDGGNRPPKKYVN